MDLFVTGALLSLSLCLDLGIVNVAIMKAGVERGVMPAFMIGLGSGVGDLIYATLSLIGISLILQFAIVRWVLWIGGTIVLLVLTAMMIRQVVSAPATAENGMVIRQKSSLSYIMMGVSLALSSPSAMLWFATVGGSIIASTAIPSKLSLLSFFGGFFAASVVWSITLAYVCHRAGKVLGPRLKRIFSMLSAVVFLFFAVKVFLNGYQTLL